MSTEPRIQPASGVEASLGTALSLTPLTAGRFGTLYAEFWQRGVSPVNIREMTRMRNARVTDCGY